MLITQELKEKTHESYVPKFLFTILVALLILLPISNVPLKIIRDRQSPISNQERAIVNIIITDTLHLSHDLWFSLNLISSSQ